MPKVKVPRKSTSVDMTAMCDVAFLLLSFFILTTKFKTEDGVQVVTPKSVSTKPAEAKNVVQVLMDKEGKVYFSVGDDNVSEKQDIIDMIDQGKNLGLTAQEKADDLAKFFREQCRQPSDILLVRIPAEFRRWTLPDPSQQSNSTT